MKWWYKGRNDALGRAALCIQTEGRVSAGAAAPAAEKEQVLSDATAVRGASNRARSVVARSLIQQGVS